MQSIGSILVVDSSSAIAYFLVEILIDEGYSAYTVPDGSSVLVALASHPPALLLLDVETTSMRGTTLIDRVCEAVLATTPMVAMTTAPREATPLCVSGAVASLHKPFQVDELLACVARYVQPAQRVGSLAYAGYPTVAA